MLSRARAAATGFVSLRVAPDGIATPAFGASSRRVRISGGALLVEDEPDGGAATRARRLHGSSLAELADLADVDLEAPYGGGAEAPSLGDVDAPIAISDADLAPVIAWFGLGQAALDAAIVDLAERGLAATPPRLWPEHFDVAVEVRLGDGRSVNLGASPGDASSSEPYGYVGPWGPERPGDAEFWNAPFGAMRTRRQLRDAAMATAFYLDGVGRLT